jgi:hypothetical protein
MKQRQTLLDARRRGKRIGFCFQNGDVNKMGIYFTYPSHCTVRTLHTISKEKSALHYESSGLGLVAITN